VFEMGNTRYDMYMRVLYEHFLGDSDAGEFGAFEDQKCLALSGGEEMRWWEDSGEERRRRLDT
jgi:hypothetical protein